MNGCATPPGPTAVVPVTGETNIRSTLPASALAPFHIVVLGDSLAAGDTGSTIADGDRWWVLARTAVQSARPDRDVVFTNFGQTASGIELVEKSVASLNARDYQVAIVMEGRNDYQSEADWSTRLVTVIRTLERQGVIVILAVLPPSITDGKLVGYGRNPCIKSIAGARPLLDFEARWFAAGPLAAQGWFADSVHASAAGQVVEAEMTAKLLLTLIK